MLIGHRCVTSIKSPSPSDTKMKPYNKLSVFLLFIVPALGGLLFGYEIGVTSASVDQVNIFVFILCLCLWVAE